MILRTGWSVFFKLPDKFFGNFADEEKQMFPGNFIKIHVKINIKEYPAVVAWFAKASVFHSVNSAFSASGGLNPALGMEP